MIAARASVVALPALVVPMPGLATSLFFIGAALLTFAVVQEHGLAPLRRAAWALPGALAVALGLVGALWSPVPERTIQTALNFAVLILPAAIVLLEPGRDRLRDAVLPLWAAGGLALALLIAAVAEVASALGTAPSIATVKGYTFLALWVWPVAGALWLAGYRRRAALAILGVAVASFASEADLSWTAAVVGGATFALATIAPEVTRRIVGPALLAVYALVLPFAVGSLHHWQSDLPAAVVGAASGRIDIWAHLSDLGWERPWFGWGMQSSGALPPIPAVDPMAVYAGVRAAYPHNVPLQVRLELGVAGLALLAAIIVSGWRAILALPRALTPFALAFAAGALWVSCISYNLWSDYTLFLFFMPIALFGIVATGRGSVAETGRGR
jgi:O-antigen ligase